jgi:hypothetical protein
MVPCILESHPRDESARTAKVMTLPAMAVLRKIFIVKPHEIVRFVPLDAEGWVGFNRMDQ